MEGIGVSKTATISQLKELIALYPAREAIHIQGPPGVGKSDMFEQVAELRKGIFLPFLAASMDPTDSTGCPMPDDITGVTKFLPPETLIRLTHAAPPERQGPIVACFDDFAAAPIQVFNALLRFFCNREVSANPKHKVRDNVLLCATSNRAEDNAGAQDLTTSQANRWHHFTLAVSVEEWCKWAVQRRLEPEIIAFVQKNGNMLHQFNPEELDEPSFATPRSVAAASRVQKAIGKDHKDIRLAMAASCGQAWAGQYMAFLKNAHRLVDPQDIFKNPETARVPERAEVDVLHTTVQSLISANMDKPTPEHCLASFRYALRIPQTDIAMPLIRVIGEEIIGGQGIKSDDSAFQSKVLADEDTWRKVNERFGKFIW